MNKNKNEIPRERQTCTSFRDQKTQFSEKSTYQWTEYPYDQPTCQRNKSNVSENKNDKNTDNSFQQEKKYFDETSVNAQNSSKEHKDNISKFETLRKANSEIPNQQTQSSARGSNSTFSNVPSKISKSWPQQFSNGQDRVSHSPSIVADRTALTALNSNSHHSYER